MRKFRSHFVTPRRTASAALAIAVLLSASPVSASDDHTDDSVVSSSSPTTSTVGSSTSLPGDQASLIQRLEAARQAVSASTAPATKKAEVLKKIDEALSRLRSGKPLEADDAQELSAAIASILGPAPSTPPAPPAPPTAPPVAPPTAPTSGVKPPSQTQPSQPSSDAASRLEYALNALKASPVQSEKKAELQKKIEETLRKMKAGEKVSEEDVSKLIAAVSSLSASPAPGSTTRPTPSQVPPAPPVSGGVSTPQPPASTPLSVRIEQVSERIRTSSLSDAKKKDLLEKVAKLRAKAASSPSEAAKEAESLFRDISQELGEPSSRPERAPETSTTFTRPSSPSEALSELSKRIDEALSRLQGMEQTEAVTAVSSALSALKARLASGEVPDQASVRSAFDQLRALVESRTSRPVPRDGASPTRPSPEAMQAKMSGAVSDALSRLEGVSTPQAVEARNALSALSTKLSTPISDESAAESLKEEFEAAMELVHKALEKLPGARHAVRLAGVIAAVEASSAPEDVKAKIIERLRAAQDASAANPEKDSRDAVKEALKEARDARVAAAVDRLGALIPTLIDAADALNNQDAALLLQQALVLLSPSDGTLPSLESLHEVRDLLRGAIDLMNAEPSDDNSDQPNVSDPASTPTDPSPSDPSPGSDPLEEDSAPPTR